MQCCAGPGRNQTQLLLHSAAVCDSAFTLEPPNLRGRAIASLVLGRNPEHYGGPGGVIHVGIGKLGSSHYARGFQTTVYPHKYKLAWIFL